MFHPASLTPVLAPPPDCRPAVNNPQIPTGKLDSFLPEQQVKAFLADARPANPTGRPASAPAGAGVGVGGGNGGGSDGRAERLQGGSRGLGETRRPGTAGAVLGDGALGAHGEQVQREGCITGCR